MVRGDNIAMVGVHVKQNTGTPLMYTHTGTLSLRDTVSMVTK